MNERKSNNQPGPENDHKEQNTSRPNDSPQQPERRLGLMDDVTDNPKPPGAALSRQVQAKLGQQLRAYYDRLIEPPPDRFVELLRRLENPGNKDSQE